MSRSSVRHRRERRFKFFGLVSIAIAAAFLLALVVALVSQGWRTVLVASVDLPVHLDASIIGETGEESALRYNRLLKMALLNRFPEVDSRRDKKDLTRLLSFSAATRLREQVMAEPQWIGQTRMFRLRLSSVAGRYLKGGIDASLPQEQRGIGDGQIAWLDELDKDGRIHLSFNFDFFVAPDSRDAESAGIGVALIGSFYSLLLAFLFSFPIGVLSAVYLELFAPRNRWLDFVEININNLAAVPSIIFGLLGLAIFINVFQMPRSSPLVGGLVLALMTLPTIIIAARASLKAVPYSYLSGAMALGATKMQGVFHHVLPSAMPGILTGTIIGMAGALGETAPLLMIGMVAFITEMPTHITDAATALPVQIFLWADNPERGYVERTAAAIIVLLIFLGVMNTAAVLMRRRLETNAG